MSDVTSNPSSEKPAAYRVLARKYRPKDFSDLMVGQEPMVRTLTNAFETGRIAQARAAWDPVAGKGMLDGRIAALGLWLTACEKAPTARSPQALDAAIAANRRDFDARYELAQGLMAAGRFTDAMDALLEIVMRDKAWNGELARKTYVAILELMSKPAPKPAPGAEKAKGALELTGHAAVAPGDPVVDQYRRKLSMALF